MFCIGAKVSRYQISRQLSFRALIIYIGAKATDTLVKIYESFRALIIYIDAKGIECQGF